MFNFKIYCKHDPFDNHSRCKYDDIMYSYDEYDNNILDCVLINSVRAEYAVSPIFMSQKSCNRTRIIVNDKVDIRSSKRVWNSTIFRSR